MMKIMRFPRIRHACLRMSLLMGIGLVLAGCTGGGPARTFNANTVDVLTCHDSLGQQGIDTAPARLIDGVDGFIGDTNAYDTLPVWRSLDGHRYLAWKMPLAVASNAWPYRTVSVLSPASARLVYASGTWWGKVSNTHMPPPPRRVRLPVCGRRYTLYVGGIFVKHPGCVTLSVAGPAGKPTTVAVPVLVTQC